MGNDRRHEKAGDCTRWSIWQVFAAFIVEMTDIKYFGAAAFHGTLTGHCLPMWIAGRTMLTTDDLRDFPFFSDLSTEQLADIAKHAADISLETGQYAADKEIVQHHSHPPRGSWLWSSSCTWSWAWR